VGSVTASSVCCALVRHLRRPLAPGAAPTDRDLGSRRESTPFPRRRDEPPTFFDRVRCAFHPGVERVAAAKRPGVSICRALALASPARGIPRRRPDRVCLRRFPASTTSRSSRSPSLHPPSAWRDASYLRVSGADRRFLLRVSPRTALPEPCRPTRSTRSCELPAGSPGSGSTRTRDGRGTCRAPCCHHRVPPARGDGGRGHTRHVR
jgi:hypothetical protein